MAREGGSRDCVGGAGDDPIAQSESSIHPKSREIRDISDLSLHINPILFLFRYASAIS